MRTRLNLVVLALTAASLLDASSARAACQCSCIGGHVQAICTSPLDSQPLCPANSCPRPAPETPTIKPLQLPTTSLPRVPVCTQSMVFNGLTQQYEWQTRCR